MRSQPHSNKGCKAKCRIVDGTVPSYPWVSRQIRLLSAGPKHPTMKRCKFRSNETSKHVDTDAWLDYMIKARPDVKVQPTSDGWLDMMPATSIAIVNKHYPRLYRPLADWSNYAR